MKFYSMPMKIFSKTPPTGQVSQSAFMIQQEKQTHRLLSSIQCQWPIANSFCARFIAR